MTTIEHLAPSRAAHAACRPHGNHGNHGRLDSSSSSLPAPASARASYRSAMGAPRRPSPRATPSGRAPSKAARLTGSLVADRAGQATPYAMTNLQERGSFTSNPPRRSTRARSWARNPRGEYYGRAILNTRSAIDVVESLTPRKLTPRGIPRVSAPMTSASRSPPRPCACARSS